MPKYQIDFNWGRSHSFEYIQAEENIEKSAADKANQCIEKKSAGASIFSDVKWPRTLIVREYDTEKKSVKRGGHKFKLRLGTLRLAYQSGSKERNEWYEPIEN